MYVLSGDREFQREGPQTATPYMKIFAYWKWSLCLKWNHPEVIQTVKWFTSMLYDGTSIGDAPDARGSSFIDEDDEDLAQMRAWENSVYMGGEDEEAMDDEMDDTGAGSGESTGALPRALSNSSR